VDKQNNRTNQFGLIVIGDEILFGSREDRHQAHFRQLLKSRGLDLARFWLLPDDEASLISHLRFSMASGMPTFVCGGIGATPDDLTRTCAAEAANRPLVRHKEAAELIEDQFGEKAYPTRIHMADLPQDAALIPNPHNRIPGFSLQRHHFLPGFPQLAWPMAEWVLDNCYADLNEHPARELALQIPGLSESLIVPIMEAFSGRFPDVKLYSLPRMGEQPSVELGLRGHGDIDSAMAALKAALQQAGISYQDQPSK
jgi:molybdopterin-biosynthesis enzyme MoeA-like protein